jgi:pimeloyl-ACP methyl ester carboxylesterase
VRWLRSLIRRFRARRGPTLNVAIDEGEGPAVVLVHGIASSSVTFENVVPLLRPRHRVIAVDLLGFGASPAPPHASFTVEQHVEYLARTIDRLDLPDRFVLVGHSLGALVTSRYAVTRSELLAGLVLVSPPVYLPPEFIGDPVDRRAMRLYLTAFELLRRKKAFTMRNAALLNRLSPIKNLLDVNEGNWNAFVLSLQNSIESQTALTDIAAASVPIQVVYGTLDPLLVPGSMRMLERLRHVTVHRVNANDHVIRKRMARVVVVAVEALTQRA